MKDRLAKVNIIEGLYIFTDSRPNEDFEIIGTVNGPTLVLSAQYSSIRSKLISRAKSKFPQGQGLIIYMNYMQLDKADVIKFKE